MEHLGGGASPESFGDNNTTSNPSGSQGQPASGSSDNSQSRTRLAGGTTFDTMQVGAEPRMTPSVADQQHQCVWHSTARRVRNAVGSAADVARKPGCFTFIV